MGRFALFVLAASTAHAASPVAKVIEMLSDLQGKIIGEGKDAQAVYDEFSEWCEDQSKKLHFEIKTGDNQVNELKATIAEETASTAAHENRIDELSDSSATSEADLKAATEIRGKENHDFVAQEKELSDVIDTLQRAIGIIEREMRGGGASMLQLQNAGNLVQALSVLVHASTLSSADASKLTAMVQSGDDDSDVGAPAGEVYASQSGNILDTLGDLLEKAEAQLDAARKKESSALRNFQLLAQSLNDEIKFAAKDMDKTKKALAESSENKANAEGDLGTTTKDLMEDNSALGQLHRDCMTKAQEFEDETKSRGEELAALAKAKAIINEAMSLSQVSFVQTASKRTSGAQTEQAVRFVRQLATKQGSAALAQLASRMASVSSTNAGDIFGKVKGLISDMIEKLESEADADATKKAYCDKELAETNEKKSDKTNEIEKLSTQIDQMSARSAELKEQVAGLQNALSNLASSQAEMDKMRAKENGLFVAEKAELEKGLKGLQLALKVLKDYYGSADKAHNAADGASSGIIGLLEVCESDFSRELAEVESVEETSQTAYERETKENEVERTTKEQDVKYKSKESTELDKAVAETNSDRSGVQAELSAVNEYLAKIEAECIAKAETYADRSARRAAEIAGLKQALEILENEAALLQRSTRRNLRHVRAH